MWRPEAGTSWRWALAEPVAPEALHELVDWFDWALDESCAVYGECDRLAVFTRGEPPKAAFHVEYVDDWSEATALAAEVCGIGLDLDTLIETWGLGREYLACP